MMIQNKNEEYVIALYIRLSKEDEDVGIRYGKEESNSISNQRMLLYDFIQQHSEFQGCRIIEKCDDGFSGKRFDRPAFTELIDLAKKGRIDCIIVKDLSRFGRDYIELGDYLEQLFPFLGIRFIAVNDHYDSKDGGQETAGLEVAFKNFIYDFYSRDTSKKIRNVRRKMAQSGQFASANAPYGYQKSAEDKHKLVVDEEAAQVVREIFQMKIAGMSAKKITENLNARQIPSPAQYALNHKRGMDWRKVNEKTAWDATKVVAILKDERYAGNMVSLRRTLKGIYGKDTPMDSSDWIRVEGTHEGIVSIEDFQKAQATFFKYKKSQPSTIKRYNAFVCGHCGRKLSYSKDRKKLICRYGESNPNASCYKAAYPAEKIRGAVLEALKWHFEQFIDWEEMQERLEKNVHAEQDSQDHEKVLEQIENGKIILYEKYKDGQIDRDEFVAGRDKLKAQAEEIKEKMKEAALRQEGKDEVKRIGEIVRKYREAKELTKEMEEMFVERVEVYDAEHIKLRWKFMTVLLDDNE